MSKGKLIDRTDIHEEMKLINGSETDYITPTGNVYKECEPDKFIHKKVHENKHNGYGYCGITMKNERKNVSKRVHRLVAEAFIEKDPEKPIVGHIDNNKMNNNASNLYWTTVSENTKKVFDDGLAVNAKGYDDSQSIEVIALDERNNTIERFGSISLCSKAVGVSKSTLTRHCKKEVKNNRKGFRFFYNN